MAAGAAESLHWPRRPLFEDAVALQLGFLRARCGRRGGNSMIIGDKPSKLREIFPSDEVSSLLSMAVKLLRQEDTVVKINQADDDDDDSPSAYSGRQRNNYNNNKSNHNNAKMTKMLPVVVFGDIHGQLHDLVNGLRLGGGISDSSIFIFNGDFVDRGAWGVECFLLLLAYKICLPNNVYLLRGNHETNICTSIYGMDQEIRVKYPDKPQLIEQFHNAFSSLPMAAIVEKTVYIVHAGLHRKQFKTKKVEVGKLSDIPTKKGARNYPDHEENVFEDMLWSDPQLENGIRSNSTRGCGLYFGPDITAAFLREHNLKLIIRSHEGPDARDKRREMPSVNEGFSFDHVTDAGRLMTLFSAPDYPQFQNTPVRWNNKGAIAILHPHRWSEPEIRSFEAAPRPPCVPYYDVDNTGDTDTEMEDAAGKATLAAFVFGGSGGGGGGGGGGVGGGMVVSPGDVGIILPPKLGVGGKGIVVGWDDDEGLLSQNSLSSFASQNYNNESGGKSGKSGGGGNGFDWNSVLDEGESDRGKKSLFSFDGDSMRSNGNNSNSNRSFNSASTRDNDSTSTLDSRYFPVNSNNSNNSNNNSDSNPNTNIFDNLASSSQQQQLLSVGLGSQPAAFPSQSSAYSSSNELADLVNGLPGAILTQGEGKMDENNEGVKNDSEDIFAPNSQDLSQGGQSGDRERKKTRTFQ